MELYNKLTRFDENNNLEECLICFDCEEVVPLYHRILSDRMLTTHELILKDEWFKYAYDNNILINCEPIGNKYEHFVNFEDIHIHHNMIAIDYEITIETIIKTLEYCKDKGCD